MGERVRKPGKIPRGGGRLPKRAACQGVTWSSSAILKVFGT